MARDRTLTFVAPASATPEATPRESERSGGKLLEARDF